MDLLLLVVALGALTAAAVFGTVAWRATEEQRRRSAARVAALASSIGNQDGAEEPLAPVAVSSIFTVPADGRVRGVPLVKAGIVGGLGVALIVFVTMTTSGNRDEAGTEATVEGAAADTTGGVPLELMSMRHGIEGTTLTVSGLVRNPRTGAQVARIAAVVFAFDRAGEFISSGRAPLDFTTLQPGDESPFVVVLPNVENVGRYRVSFRTEAGTVGHVDRRAGRAAAERDGAGSASLQVSSR